MKIEIDTRIEIEASAAAVWDILADFRSYPQWNPLVISVEGEAKPGAAIRIAFRPPTGGVLKARAAIEVCEPGKELTWVGRGPVPGLLEGRHFHALEPLGENRVRLRHGEIFRGLLVPFLRKSMTTLGPAAYEKLNVALKKRAEKK